MIRETPTSEMELSFPLKFNQVRKTETVNPQPLTCIGSSQSAGFGASNRAKEFQVLSMTGCRIPEGPKCLHGR